MSESVEERRARKRQAGMIDQGAAVLSGYGGAVFTAGTVAPIVATVIGAYRTSPAVIVLVSLLSTILSLALVAASALMKGRAKVLDDDRLAEAGLSPTEEGD